MASSASSNVVALVEQEPWAEELLLCVEDTSGSRVSDKIDFPSPLPFNNDGALELRKLLVVPVLTRELRLDLNLPVGMVPVIPETDDAVDGRLPALGGCGNEAMLIVRRRILSGLPGARPLDADRIAVRLDVEIELESGVLANDGFGLEGVRNLDS